MLQLAEKDVLLCDNNVRICEKFTGCTSPAMKKNICDPLWTNRPLTNFHEIRVLGMDRRRIYCTVQRSKDQSL